MTRQNFVLMLVLCANFGVLSGCVETPPVIPALTKDTLQSTWTPMISIKESSTEVLKACPVDKQVLAMRTGQAPDWDHLGLFACYSLSLSLVDPGNPFSATEILVMTNPDTTPMDEIVLRIYPNAKNIYGGNITISEVVASQKTLQTEFFLSDRSALRVLLEKPLLPNETITLELNYTIDLPIITASPESYGIFGQSPAEPILTMANWFPILAPRQNGQWLASPVLQGGDAVTSNSALFQVSITTPPAWQVAATGKEITRREVGGNVRHEYVSGPVRDFMISVSPDFLVQKLQMGDLLITQYGLESTSAKWDQALITSRAAIDYFQKTYGPYPFNEIDIVAVPLHRGVSGVEYPGLILITSSAYLSGSRQGLLEVVIAHELAHQWWYSMVGNDVLANPWQDEGLTTSSTLDYFRAISSPIYQVLLKDYQDRVNAYEKEHSGESITQPLSAFRGRESAYSILVYAKAALFFESIRTHMGQLNYDKALRQYYQANQYLLTQPAALIQVFQQNCQCNLSDLFKEYGVSQFTP